MTVDALKRNLLKPLQPHLPECQELQCQHLVLNRRIKRKQSDEQAFVLPREIDRVFVTYLLAIFGIKAQRVHDYRAHDKYPPNRVLLVR